MFWLICKIICLVLTVAALILLAEYFREDYLDKNLYYVVRDSIVIICLVANAVVLIMWA